MKINIVNISDFPAQISFDEKKKWLFFINDNDIFISDNINSDKNTNIKEINKLLESDDNKSILFSSWWFDTINNVNQIWNNIWIWNKILIWFSDTLHLQAKFFNKDNVFNIYGITLRNIFELNNYNKNLLFEFLNNQKFTINLLCYETKNNNISGRLHWWHLMIFITILDIYLLEVIEDDIIYLEFHWMEEYFIKYYLDILKYKWVFNKISWIILDEKIDNIEIEYLLSYFSQNWVENIYALSETHFLPFYKSVNIKEWQLSI